MTYSFEPTGTHEREAVFRPDHSTRFESEVGDAPSLASVTVEHAQGDALERFRADAFAAGEREARLQLEPTARALTAAAEALAQQRVTWLEAQRTLLAELAISIAARIIGESLDVHPEWIVSRVSAALAVTQPSVPATLELNPRDYEIAVQAFEGAPLAESIQLVRNPSLEPGDLVVCQGAMTIDARIASLLEGAREQLAGLESMTVPPEESREES